MSDYILVVSTPKPPAWISEVLSPQQQTAQEHIAAIKQMETNLPALHRESIPELDTGLDVARCLASIASTVARSTTSMNTPSESPARKARDRHADTAAARIDAVISACYEVEHHVARTIERVKPRLESQAQPGSLSSSSTSSLPPQFQSFALSPSAALAPSRIPLTSLQFATPNIANLSIQRGSHDQTIPGSFVVPEGERPLLTMLEVPVNPIEPYRPNTLPPGAPSFPSSPSSEPTPESPTKGVKQRRTSIAKSPSRGELNRSATRKRSGFLRNMLPGRRDE